LRLKGNLTVFDGAETTTTAACAEKRTFYLEDVELTARRVRTHIGIIHDPGHPEPWIIAMSERPGYQGDKAEVLQHPRAAHIPGVWQDKAALLVEGTESGALFSNSAGHGNLIHE
jgi:hypothetical protein